MFDLGFQADVNLECPSLRIVHKLFCRSTLYGATLDTDSVAEGCSLYYSACSTVSNNSSESVVKITS
jgi:hypothetical protein